MPAAITAPPSVDLAEVARLRTAIQRLNRRLRQQGNEGITPSQLAVLGTLDRQGAMTLGELAAHERVQPPTITRIARGLEEAGLVARWAVAEDRRVARVELSAAGRRLVQSIRGRRNAWLAQRMARLAPRHLADLSRGLLALEAMLEEDPA